MDQKTEVRDPDEKVVEIEMERLRAFPNHPFSVQGKFLCNNITEGFTFFRYKRDTKFERGTKHWQKEWQVSIKKDVLPAEYVKILVRWQRPKFTMDVMLW